eukprot:1818550-Pleurochrysis_carterae.AAC.2
MAAAARVLLTQLCAWHCSTRQQSDNMLHASAGVDSSYGKGMQDATERTNRFTSTDKVPSFLLEIRDAAALPIHSSTRSSNQQLPGPFPKTTSSFVLL